MTVLTAETQSTTQEAPPYRPQWWQAVLLVLVLAVLLGPAAVTWGSGVVAGWWEPYNQTWYDAGYAAGLEAGRQTGASGMASYTVTGAGDATYNGDYTLVGNDADGNPYYTIGSGATQRWLALVVGLRWELFDTDYQPSPWPDAGAYVGTGLTLPANPWAQGGDLGALPAPTVSEAATTHTIEGTVLESDDTPVEDVDVLATLGSTASDTTDAYGEYEITGLGDGTWVVTTQSLALADPHRIWLTGSPLKPASTSVIFNSPTPITSIIPWTLYWGAAGQVTIGASGLPGVTVDIYTAAGVLTASVLTDSNGDWSWSGGPKGNYVARFTKTGYTFAPAQVALDLTGSAPVTGADAVASRGDVLFQGAGAGQGTTACLLTLVRALSGVATGAATGTCVLTVASPADKRAGAYYRYLTRMWSE